MNPTLINGLACFLIFIGTLLLAFWDKIPPRKIKRAKDEQSQQPHRLHVYHFRIPTAIVGALLVYVGTFLTLFSAQKESNMQAERLTENKTQVIYTRKDIQDAKKVISELLMLLANKPELDTSTRADILQTRRKYAVGLVTENKLSALASAWNDSAVQVRLSLEQQRLKTAEPQRKLVEPSLEVWDYTIRRFQTILAEYLKQNGVTVTSDYAGLPTADVVCQGYADEDKYSEYRSNVCVLTVQTGIEWSCECTIIIPLILGRGGGYSPELTITAKGLNASGVLRAYEWNGRVSTTVDIGGMLPVTSSSAMTDYQKCVDAAIDGFIGAQATNFATDPM